MLYVEFFSAGLRFLPIFCLFEKDLTKNLAFYSNSN